ncbi:hypothetical protein BJF78_35935 [Pseudonocardia sp. CNS-139]|nr:hypothetical protein BJF78_35935 [Pseudonocardia sp. CNS-139]
MQQPARPELGNYEAHDGSGPRVRERSDDGPNDVFDEAEFAEQERRLDAADVADALGQVRRAAVYGDYAEAPDEQDRKALARAGLDRDRIDELVEGYRPAHELAAERSAEAGRADDTADQDAAGAAGDDECAASVACAAAAATAAEAAAARQDGEDSDDSAADVAAAEIAVDTSSDADTGADVDGDAR